jgi:hypothetical protein
MDREQATTIVESYRAVLEETAGMVSGAPESKLPCDRSLIKEALKLLVSETARDDESYPNLKEAFCKLALFIPDEQARIVALAEGAVMTMDPTNEGFPYLNQHADIQTQIQNRMSELENEISAFVKTQVD